MSYRDLPALLAAIEEAAAERPAGLDTTAFVPCARPDCDNFAVRWLSPYCCPDCARRVASWVDQAGRQDHALPEPAPVLRAPDGRDTLNPSPGVPRRIDAPPVHPAVQAMLEDHRETIDSAIRAEIERIEHSGTREAMHAYNVFTSTTPDTSTRDRWDDALRYARSSPNQGVLDGDWGRPTHVDSMGHVAHGCAIQPAADLEQAPAADPEPATAKPRPKPRPPWRRLLDTLRRIPW